MRVNHIILLFILKQIHLQYRSDNTVCERNYATKYCLFMYFNQKDNEFEEKFRDCYELYRHKAVPLSPYIQLVPNDYMHSSLGYNGKSSYNYRNHEYRVSILHGHDDYSAIRFSILEQFHIMQIMVISHAAYIRPRNDFNHFRDLEQHSLQYLQYACSQLFQQKLIKNSNANHDIIQPFMCPNPCNDPNICARKAFTSVEAYCIPIGVGVHDYRCACKPGYVWRQSSLSCDESPVCKHCNRNGTRECKVHHTIDSQVDEQRAQESFFECVCDEQHDGLYCDMQRDACKKTNRLYSPVPGNVACRVDMSGLCYAELGASHFECTCPPGYKANLSLRYSNCELRDNICSSTVCANHGQCYASPDGSMFHCLCSAGFSGRFCQQPVVNQWSFWSEWSQCDSDCGFGWQSRHRRCGFHDYDNLGHYHNQDNNHNKDDSQAVKYDCQGDKIEYRDCQSHCKNTAQINQYVCLAQSVEITLRMIGLSVAAFIVLNIAVSMLYNENEVVFIAYVQMRLIDMVRHMVYEQPTTQADDEANNANRLAASAKDGSTADTTADESASGDQLDNIHPQSV